MLILIKSCAHVDACSGKMRSYKLSKGQYMYADCLALVDVHVPGWWKCLYECGYIHRRSQNARKGVRVSGQTKKLSPLSISLGAYGCVWTMGVSGSECV